MADPSTREREDLATQSEAAVQRPRLWKVLLHNDDYTTQEFVVWVLETVFRKPRGEAYAIMMNVHRSGLGLAGVYTHDVAVTRVASAKRLAEQHEFPLLVTMEPEDE